LQGGKDSGRISDLFVYYVGHGKLGKYNDRYYLAIPTTLEYDPYSHSITLYALSAILETYAKGLRRFLILDSCFAAAALPELSKIHDVLSDVPRAENSEEEQSIIGDSPGATCGTSLLCAASVEDAAKIGPKYTYFTEALVSVLNNGMSHAPGLTSIPPKCPFARSEL
jgi:hypothetical protein